MRIDLKRIMRKMMENVMRGRNKKGRSEESFILGNKYIIVSYIAYFNEFL